MEEILTIREAAKYLKVPVAQIYNLANSGMIKAFKIGRHWRIPVDGLKEWMVKMIKIENLR